MSVWNLFKNWLKDYCHCCEPKAEKPKPKKHEPEEPESKQE